MAKQTTPKQARIDANASEQLADMGETGGVSQWARELGRVHSGGESVGRAGNRFYKLATFLADAAKPGQTVALTFGQCNDGAQLRREVGAAGVSSWVTAVQRMRQMFGGVLPGGIVVAVNRETAQVEVTLAK